VTDHTIQEVIIVRRRNRVWRMVQFLVVTLIMLMALMNVFVWQFVIDGKEVAAFIVIGFLYLTSFLECFNYYHFDCPFCGMELKTSDFDMGLVKRCMNCGHTFNVHYIEKN